MSCHLVNSRPFHGVGQVTVALAEPLLVLQYPEVYTVYFSPFFGIVTEILPVFSRKPVFGYKGMVFATMAIAALSTGV